MVQQPIHVFISYSHDSPEHEQFVLRLARELRRNGVDAQLDQFHVSPEEGWTSWMERSIECSAYVLCVCTPQYRKKFEKAGSSGAGVTFEGHVLRLALHEQGTTNRKIIPVLPDGTSNKSIPRVLCDWTRYSLPSGFESLLRHVTGQPKVVPAPLGEIPNLPPVDVAVATAGQSHDDPQRAGTSPANFERPPAPTPFSGRGDELEALSAALRASQVVVVEGMPGIGKSGLARAFAARAENDGVRVAWINLPGVAGTEIASALHDVIADAKNVATRRRFWSKKPWADVLLILDDVSGPLEIASLLPRPDDGRVRVLITTALRGLSSRFSSHAAVSITLGPLNPNASYELLASTIGYERLQRDISGQIELFEFLGGHPLAIRLTATLIDDDQTTSLAAFVERLRSGSQPISVPDRLDEPKNRSVEVSLEAGVASLEAALQRDFERIGVFGPRSFSMADATALLPPGRAEISIPALVRASLLDAQLDGRFVFHPLVAQFASHRNPKASRTARTFYLVRALSSARFFEALIAVNPRASWAHLLAQEMPHIIAGARIAAENLAAELGCPLEDALHQKSLPRTTATTWVSLSFADAIDNLRRQLHLTDFPEVYLAGAVAAKALGMRPIEALYTEHLGCVYLERASYDEAVAWFEHALSIPCNRERKHIRALAYGNMSLAFRETGQLDRALEYVRRGQELSRELNRPPDELAVGIHNEGRILHDLNRLDEAEALYRQALAMKIAVDPAHPDLVYRWTNLGLLLADRGDNAGALAEFKRAFALISTNFGDDHPNAAVVCNNMAMIFQRQGDQERAAEFYTRALALAASTKGLEHPMTRHFARNVGRLMRGE